MRKMRNQMSFFFFLHFVMEKFLLVTLLFTMTRYIIYTPMHRHSNIGKKEAKLLMYILSNN